MIDTLLELDNVRLNFSEDGKTLLNLTIAFIMFGVALELNPRDFLKLFKQPKAAFVGIFSQFVGMPLVTFLFVYSLQTIITPTIGLGMILVAACPGGNISNFISALSRGNIALSVSLTAFSSLGGMLLTPLNFAFWGGLYLSGLAQGTTGEMLGHLEIDYWEVLQTIVLILGIPLVIGITVNQRFKVLTEKLIVPIKRFSILAFLSMIVIIFSKNFDLFTTYIQYIFFIVLAHNALALSTGYGLASLFKLDQQSKRTIAIETGIQNSGLALALLFNPGLFPTDLALGGMTFIAAWWGVWHIVSGLTLAGYWTGFKLGMQSPAT